MSLAQATLVLRVRQLLGDNPWATTASASSSSSVVAVPDGTKWDEGAIVEFSVGGEQAYVTSVSGNNLTCIRGYNGTTAATQASQTVVRDPFFTYKQITDACDQVIQSLWPYVYKKVTATVTPTAGQSAKWYDLASTAMALIQVTQVVTAPTPDQLVVYGQRGSGLPIRFARNLPTALVASGVGIQFPTGPYNSTDTIQVDYAAKLTNTIATSAYSDLDDGILADVVAFGAAARLTLASDVPRATQEDIGMGDSSVQVGMRSSVGRSMYQQFIFLRNQYNEELRRTMPLMGISSGGFNNSGRSGYRTPPYS